MPTGEIEIGDCRVEILNVSEPPPFQLNDRVEVDEMVRLAHRYVDLRTERMQRNLRIRAKVNASLRRAMDGQGFVEIETPMLIASTPEGARDFVVPSRLSPGSFYALPQSPQLFKQLCMVGGIDRYYQIARCFRDEDFRADRQPEFTQVDIETSFMNEEDIMTMVEKMIREMYKKVASVDLPTRFQRMTYQEAMHKYGSDKPDMRVTLEITELTDLMKDVDFKVFSGAATMKGGRVAAIRVPNGSAITRSEIDAYTEFIKIYGAKGLAYIKINDINELNETGLQSPSILVIGDVIQACAQIFQTQPSSPTLPLHANM